MYLAKIKRKSQVTVPAQILKQAGLKLGDFLEFVLEKDKIRLYPKRLMDPQNELLPENAELLRKSC